jgi:hypothetical protein
MTSPPPQTWTSLSPAAARARSTARATPPVSKWKAVPPGFSSGSRSRWVTTKTGVWKGGSSPHGRSPRSNMRRPMTQAP